MKTITKVTFGLLIVGIACCAGAIGMGVSFSDTHNLRAVQYRENAHNQNIQIASDIKHLELDIDAVNCTVREGENWGLTAGKYTEWEVYGDTLAIQSDLEDGWWYKSKPADITLTIPKGLSLDGVEIDLDAGTVDMAGIQANSLNANVDAGVLIFTGTVYGPVSLDCDAGSMELHLQKGSTIGRVQGSADIGEVEVLANGQDCINSSGLSEDFSTYIPNAVGADLLTADCDAGSISIDLEV